jgi:hypothetical protein
MILSWRDRLGAIEQGANALPGRVKGPLGGLAQDSIGLLRFRALFESIVIRPRHNQLISLRAGLDRDRIGTLEAPDLFSFRRRFWFPYSKQQGIGFIFRSRNRIA